MYRYKAFVKRVIDGDTIDLDIDLGFKTHLKERIRLYGIDAPEIHTKDLKKKQKGIEVMNYLKEKIENKDVEIETEKTGKFGRYLARVYYKDILHPAIMDTWICLNDELIKKGMAKEYWGEKRA